MKKLFDEVPYCEGSRVVLKRVSAEDKGPLTYMVNSSNVYRYLPTFLYEKSSSDIDHIIGTLYTECIKESLITGIYVEGKFCGLAEFYGYMDDMHKVSVGYRLLEEYRGRGIATETLGLMLDYIRNNTDIGIVTASTMVENKASANVLRKNGFVMVVSSVEEDWGYPEPVLADKWIW